MSLNFLAYYSSITIATIVLK